MERGATIEIRKILSKRISQELLKAYFQETKPKTWIEFETKLLEIYGPRCVINSTYEDMMTRNQELREDAMKYVLDKLALISSHDEASKRKFDDATKFTIISRGFNQSTYPLVIGCNNEDDV